MRRVKRQVLTSTSHPPIRLKFDKTFKYFGSQSFVLYDWVQAKKKRIKRMYMMQVEGYLPNIKATYDYPVTKPLILAGQTYIGNAEAIPNVPAALKQNPESDVPLDILLERLIEYEDNVHRLKLNRWVRYEEVLTM